MQIMYHYITCCIGKNCISFIWLSIYNRTVLVSHSNLTCTFTSTQVNATDIAEHCDTMSQKRNLNSLYWSIIIKISGFDS